MWGWQSIAALRWKISAVVLLACFWTNPARPTSGLTTERPASLEVEARAGDVRSILASKIGGEYRLQLQPPSGLEEKSIYWRQPSVVAMSWIAPEDGAYTIRCAPLEPSPSPPCELTVTQASGPASIEVETELRRGYDVLETWSAQAREKAEQIFRTALERTSHLPGTGTAVDSRLGLARTLSLSGKPEEAVPLLDEAVAMSTSSGDARRRTLALMQLLQCLDTMGDADRMEEISKEILAETDDQGLPLGKADATLGLGNVNYLRSEFRDAEALYADARERYHSVGDLEGVIEARLGLAYALMDQGRDAMAKPQLEEALEAARAIGDRRREALALRVLGLAHSKLSESSAAIRYFELAQGLFEDAGDEASLVALYNSLGELHLRTNDLPSSLDYYRKASALAQRTGFALGGVQALLGVGWSLRLLDQDEEAVRAYETARTLAIEMGHQAIEGAALAGLGNVFADRKEFGRAIECLQSAVSMNIEAGNTRKAAEFLNDLADAYFSMGRLDDASKSSQQALTYVREPNEQARALASLANVLRQQGHLDEARRFLELALDIDEAMRLRVPGADLRALAFQGAERRYGSYIALLMQIAKEKEEPNASRLALEAVERSRSRALLDGVRGSFEPATREGNDSITERERELLAEVRKLALQTDLGGGPEQTVSVRLAELRRLRSLLTDNAQPSAGVAPIALPVDEIEGYFSKDDVLLLEYFLGEERSYVWAVGGGRFEVHELSPERVIEERIRRTFELLTVRQVESQESLHEQASRNRESDLEFFRETLSLSRELLGSISDIDRFSRLVIVSNGALNYFPIGVLAHPQRSGDSAENYVPLITTHEVLRAPSVTSMVAMAFRAEGRSPKSLIAILADPVFTADDPRVHSGGRSASRDRQETISTMEANLRGSGRTLASLPRLLASREELSSIANLAPRAATTATDFMADRATAERLLRESYRVVHFATHGVLNDRYPELSGIVMSLVDDQGQPRDGFLRVQDIYGIRIEADLVVLSACESALGHVLKGEGITGLVTAMMHAGAGSVVASKWKVDDLATRQLMEEFYRGLFLTGLDSAAALRAAQVSLWKRKRTHAPFYWGAFELHGTSVRADPW